MAKAGYQFGPGQGVASIALVAATAKTVLFVVAGATFGIDWKKYRISFDGVTASNVPVYVELNYLTAASNSTPGTGNTTAVASQNYGRVIAHGMSAGFNCTSEPTVQTNIDAFMLTPNGGTVIYDHPLGDVPDSAVSQGFCIRLTAPAAVNVRPSMWIERM